MRWGAKLSAIAFAILLSIPPLLNATQSERKVPVSITYITPFKKEEKTVIVSENDVKTVGEMLRNAESSLKILQVSEEKEEAMEIVEKLVNKLKELKLLPANFPINRLLTNLFNPKLAIILPIISFGSGFSWIPLYPGEAFIGFMFRPILMQYFLFGYTATLNINFIPPRIEYWDMVGTHTMVVLGFVGIYIDFGKIGYGIPNLQFLFGEALFVGGFDWL